MLLEEQEREDQVIEGLTIPTIADELSHNIDDNVTRRDDEKLKTFLQYCLTLLGWTHWDNDFRRS